MSAVMHILLAEDDPGDVFLLHESLKNSSLLFDIHVVDNGEKALDYLYRRTSFSNARTPDLILLDLNLPRISGLEILRSIKSTPELSGIPVIVLTSSETKADVVLCHQLGVNGFFSKPPSFEGFLELGTRIEFFWNWLTEHKQ